MPITTLGIILGYHCNIRCRSCLWGERLESKEAMSVADVKEYIDQGASLGTIRMVGFTGGEPTLFQKQLRAGMQHAKSGHRLPSGLSTNCSWAVSPEKATHILADYFGLGLRYLQLSVDDFHDEWVSQERVRNCLRAALSLKIRCTLTCVVSKNSRRAADFLRIVGVSEHPLLDVQDVPCTPVGYAAHKIEAESFERKKGIPQDFCSMLDVINILPDGSVQSCCGAPFHISALKAGNVKHTALKEIVTQAEWDPVFTGLSVGVGPAELVQLLDAKTRKAFESREYTNACEACHHVFADKEITARIRQAAEDRRSEYFLRRAVTVQERDRAARLSRSAGRLAG
jgi:MoaA/NifB/PqqE/SkfB family radical SAM enzyme